MYSSRAITKTSSVNLMRDDDLDHAAPSNDMVQLYKEKLDRSRKDYQDLAERFHNLNAQVQEKVLLENELQSVEFKVRKLTDMLSKTQALLITERKQSQQMALRIDLLQRQHEMDKEKLDQLLSLSGKPANKNMEKNESMLRHKILHLETLLKEQASSLLEERSVMKQEWDRERQMHERNNKQLKDKVRSLEEQLIRSNCQFAFLGQKSIEDFLNGGTGEVYYHLLDNNNTETFEKDKMNHCDHQEMKKLKKKVEELQNEISSFQKKNLSQSLVINQLNEQLKLKEDKLQAHTKSMQDLATRLKQQNAELNKRRLNEGAGFRAEIQLLKEQLQRTQRQLCYLTVRNLGE